MPYSPYRSIVQEGKITAWEHRTDHGGGRFVVQIKAFDVKGRVLGLQDPSK